MPVGGAPPTCYAKLLNFKVERCRMVGATAVLYSSNPIATPILPAYYEVPPSTQLLPLALRERRPQRTRRPCPAHEWIALRATRALLRHGPLNRPRTAASAWSAPPPR